VSSTEPRFRVGIPAVQRERLLRWRERAAVFSRDREFVSAVARATYPLQYEADGWESQYDYLPHLRIRMRRGTEEMLIVYFGVHESLPEVFVSEFRLTADFRAAIFPPPA
jgi:hypothetical protein